MLPACRDAARRIASRRPAFALLGRLVAHGASDQQAGLDAIVAQRALLADPDPVPPLISTAADTLRLRINTDQATWSAAWVAAEQTLHGDPNWSRLTPEQRHDIRARNRLRPLEAPTLGTPAAIADALDGCSLAQRRAETSAIKGRVDDALMEAAQVFAPKVRPVADPRDDRGRGRARRLAGGRARRIARRAVPRSRAAGF